MMPGDTHTRPRAMTKTQLAALYKVCARTLEKWIEPFKTEVELNPGTYIYTPAQVKTIFEKLGEP